MRGFEDTLWEDLVAQHGHMLSRPTTTRRVARWVTLAAAAAASVTAIIVGPSLFGGSPPAAYAVDRHPDGTVTLTINELEAVDQANADLRRLGVRAVILRQPDPDHLEACAGQPSDGPSLVGEHRSRALAFPDESKPNKVTIYPKAIPQDTTLGLMYAKHPWGWSLSAGLVRGEPAGCGWWQVMLGAPSANSTR